jgi:hypothetical protein
MESEIENINSTNDETIETTDSSNSEAETETETEQYTEREKQLYARLKKLEAERKETPFRKPKQSDDFGYDVKAYLKASGIASNEFEFVQAELKASGIKDVDSLLDNEYFKDKLNRHRELSKTAEATPTGKRSSGVATDSVEYWASKPIEDVPANMRRQVVNARLNKEQSTGKFYNS